VGIAVVRTGQATGAVRVVAVVRSGQSAARVVVRTMSVCANWQAASGRNGAAVLKALVRAADETTRLPSAVVGAVAVVLNMASRVRIDTRI
jgi:hypothetical protein